MRNETTNEIKNKTFFFCKKKQSEHIENRIDYKYTVKKSLFSKML